MAQQSLYRRYRPRRFSEVRGQEHVVTALRNAVRTGTEGHAYLFSGPRGTGKTSTARILAKALNCEDLRDGEPCCECGPCVEMEAGRSFDLFELDAASNNGVDAIRDLTERAAVGSPGRTKVYILDEVHMLSTAASNALLKTLEEPPGHVCFVLATTDPQKVLPTIRSRTQHYDFQLLSAQELTDYVRWIDSDASLHLAEASVAHVVREGRGSARDTLSTLDQVVAAGGVIARDVPVEQLLRSLSEHDSGGAVRAVSDAIAAGSDPRVLAEAFLVELRDAFLLSLGVEVTHLVDTDLERLRDWARVIGTPTLTRSVEAVGSALVDMRNAADPRVPLEVALVRLCSTSSDAGAPAASSGGDAGVVADLMRRVDALERALADGENRPSDAAGPGRRSAVAAPEEPSAVPSPSADPAAESTTGGPSVGSGDGPARARAALGAVRKGDPTTPTDRRSAPSPSPPPAVPRRADAPAAGPAPSTPRPAEPPPAGPSAADRAGSGHADPGHADPGQAESGQAESGQDEPTRRGPSQASGAVPDRDALALAFGDVVVPSLKGVAKAVYGAGRFVSVSEAGAVFAVENAPTRDRAERFRPDVEAALTAHFGTPVRLVLVDGSDPNAVPAGPPADAPGVSDASAPGAGAHGPAPVDPAQADQSKGDQSKGDEADDESIIGDVHELEDADVAASGVEKLTKAFPGSVLVDGAEGTD